MTKAMANFRNGVGIWTRALRNITIAKEGTRAIIQPGVQAGEVTKILWESGKQVGKF